MALFGRIHLLLLLEIAALATLLSVLCRRGRVSGRTVRLALGFGLAGNEFVWWIFRYSHEGLHLGNLPLQLCDLTLWAAVLACLRPVPWIVEFAYLAGLAGAGMALLTPDLWSPWPSYPAIYFFVAHGGIVVAVAALVFGGVAHPGVRPPWLAFGLLLIYTAAVGGFNAISGANYMYLCRKPRSATLLNAFGPWPIYIAVGLAAALALFWLLWLPMRASARSHPA